jgi:hypothetical protein
VQEEEMAITVAMPPQMQVNNIQTIAEIEADLAETMGVGGMVFYFSNYRSHRIKGLI